MSVPVLIAFLVAGFVVLMVAGDLLVRGAAVLARRGGVPPLIVGLTIVAFGTSVPEMVVSVQAVLSNAGGLALGNVVGSNIANILLVLSVPTLFAAVPIQTPGLRRNTFIMVLATAVFIALAAQGPLSAWQGGVLIGGILVFTGAQFLRARRRRDEPEIADSMTIDAMAGMPRSWLGVWTFILIGLAGLPGGGYLIVRGGVGLAEALHVPSEFVGLTVVAVGTSLPELATSTVAAIRKHSEVAIGNVVGSNIFNVFAVGGVTALSGTIAVPESFLVWDFPVMMAAAVALLVIVLSRRPIGWATGLVLFAAYVAYIVRLAQIDGLL
jgi:cation:H+ antiporter